MSEPPFTSLDIPLQFPLALSLDEDASFDNFWHKELGAVFDYLRDLANSTVEQWCLLSGTEGVGKTHLLQAVVNFVHEGGGRALYLDCEELLDAVRVSKATTRSESASVDVDSRDESTAELLLGSLYDYDLLAFDNVHAVLSDAELQRALFYLLVKLKERSDSKLLMASAQAVSQLEAEGLLPDLSSRLNSATAFRLAEYDDKHKKAILMFRSRRLGLEIADDVAEYIMQRYSRDLSALVQALKKLDAAALSQKRRLTIPLLKQTLAI